MQLYKYSSSKMRFSQNLIILRLVFGHESDVSSDAAIRYDKGKREFCAKFHDIWLKSWDAALETTNVSLMVALEERSWAHH